MRRIHISLVAAGVALTLMAPIVAAAAPLPALVDDAAVAAGSEVDATLGGASQPPVAPAEDVTGSGNGQAEPSPSQLPAQAQDDEALGGEVGADPLAPDAALTCAIDGGQGEAVQAATPLAGGHPCLQAMKSSCTLANSRYLDLNLDPGSGMLVRVAVRLRQAEVRRTALNDFKALRRRMWNANPPLDGRPLRSVLEEAGIRSANEFADRVVWDYDAERMAIQRAAEQLLTGIAHERPGTGRPFELLLQTGQGMSSENLACRPQYMTPSVGLKMWEDELPTLIKHNGAFRQDTGHLYLLLDPSLRFHAFAQSEDAHYVNVSIDAQGSGAPLAVGDGCYAVDVPIPVTAPVALNGPDVLARNQRSQLSATAVYRDTTYSVIGTYVSSAPDVLAVDAATGHLTPLKPGMATISFTPKGTDRTFKREIEVNGQIIMRLSGPDRVSTAVRIAAEQSASPVALLVTGRNYADALSAGGLSRIMDAPVYLTNSSAAIEPQVLDAMKKRGVKKVVILGGQRAVPTSVEGGLRDAGIEIERIAGKDRAETSVLIAERALPLGAGLIERILVTDGANFPDGLAAGAISQNAKSITLVTNGSDLSARTAQFIIAQSGTREIVSVGGAGDRALAATGITADKRVVGASRVETAAQLARTFPSGVATEENPSRVVIANGLNFPDALAASGLTARAGGVLLLTGAGVLDPLTEKHLKALPRPVTAFIVGGERMVSKQAERSVMISTR